eukprot:2129602-Prymnesium_polylepis.1
MSHRSCALAARHSHDKIGAIKSVRPFVRPVAASRARQHTPHHICGGDEWCEQSAPQHKPEAATSRAALIGSRCACGWQRCLGWCDACTMSAMRHPQRRTCA